MIKKVLTNRNICLFLLQNFMINVSIAVFLLSFNLHIYNIIESKTFLSNFLLIGNISMAMGGLLLGRCLDSFPKALLLRIILFLCALFFALECFVDSPILLYGISFFYGLSYSLYMCIRGPFIMQYGTNEEQVIAFHLLSSFGLLGSAIGTLLGGVLVRTNFFNFSDPNSSALFFASVMFSLSILPSLWIDSLPVKEQKIQNKTHKKEPFFNLFKRIEFKFYWKIVFIEIILGLLIFFSPYLNLYLSLRYEMDIIYISIVLTINRFFPIITNIFFTKLYTRFTVERIVRICIVACAISYLALSIFNIIPIQLLLILLATALSTFVFSAVDVIVLSQIDDDIHGMFSGHLNLWYNIGDAIGTYLEGLLLQFSLFNLSFAIASILFFLLLFLLRSFQH